MGLWKWAILFWMCRSDRGLPDKVGGLSDVVKQPMFATVVGLLMHAQMLEKDKVPGADKSTDWTRKMKNIFGIGGI